MKRLLSYLLILGLLLVSMSGTALAMSGDELQAFYDYEMEQARYIVNRGAAYEYEGLLDYNHYWFQKVYLAIEKGSTSLAEVEGIEDILNVLKEKREGLVQIVDDPEDVCWYLWDDNLPQAEDAGAYDYTNKFDLPGFKPFLVPYLLDDQVNVKGNVIIIAGGGFNQRCNDGEGYNVAQFMNKIGFNAYVLQRRVEPSLAIDSSLDLQRAVRYLRYHSDVLGIGNTENIVTIGFSGGGMTIMNQLNTCYGDITPDAIYADYVCDEIDQVNSDYPVTAVLYGVMSGYATDNLNMPDIFLCAGVDDNKVPVSGSIDLFNMAIEHGWQAELHIFNSAPHGFGLGVRAFTDIGYTSAAQFPELLETFLNIRLGYESDTY